MGTENEHRRRASRRLTSRTRTRLAKPAAVAASLLAAALFSALAATPVAASSKTTTTTTTQTASSSTTGATLPVSDQSYWLATSDGGIFTFGNARFYGSMGGGSPPYTITAMTMMFSGKG